MKRKLMIVIEETGAEDGKGFNVYLAGDKERIGKIPEEKYSTAEWWTSRLFSICIKALRESGVIKTEMPMNNSKGEKH